LCGLQHHCYRFFNLSGKELIGYLSKTKDSFCGRFDKTQLGRLIAIQEPSNTPVFCRLLFGTILAAGVATTSHAQTNTQTTISGTTIIPGNSKKVIGEVALRKQVVTDKPHIISGRISDNIKDLPLKNASIIVYIEGTEDSIVYSDSNGRYSFNIPDTDLNKTITIIPDCLGYQGKMRSVESNKFPQVINFEMEKFTREKFMGKPIMNYHK
jgi:hypothetical protein